MEIKYYTRKEVANIFNISIATLKKIICENKIKESFLTWEKDSYWNKVVRIKNTELDKLIKIIDKK